MSIFYMFGKFIGLTIVIDVIVAKSQKNWILM